MKFIFALQTGFLKLLGPYNTLALFTKLLLKQYTN